MKNNLLSRKVVRLSSYTHLSSDRDGRVWGELGRGYLGGSLPWWFSPGEGVVINVEKKLLHKKKYFQPIKKGMCSGKIVEREKKASINKVNLTCPRASKPSIWFKSYNGRRQIELKINSLSSAYPRTHGFYDYNI